MKLIKQGVFTLGLSILSIAACADFSVIVHPSSTGEFTEKEISRLYLAKSTRLPDGTMAIPLNVSADDQARVEFERKLIGKSTSQLKAYWAQLIFTGKAVPIEELESDKGVVAKVAATPGAMGYVESTAVTSDVKVVLTY